MTLDIMTGITEGSYTGFCKRQLITCKWVKECNGVCPFEDALKHADKMQTMNERHTVDHDRDWIIGCIEHDGFIHTHRFDKANQIIHDALSAEAEWIPCSERLPECEQEVLICTEKKLVGKDAYIDSIITPAIYEDGTMLEVESMWNWCDMDFDEWDDTEDCGIIPMGWFENRHFNPDEVYNNPVDRKVVAWMPLPEPYREDGGGE